MVKKNPYTPHLRRKHGFWICSGLGYAQTGATPGSAYQAWSKGFQQAKINDYNAAYNSHSADTGFWGSVLGGIFG